MKRIVALAAVMFGLLAIPATAAMASTSSSGGSGWGGPQPYSCYYGYHRVHHGYQRYFEWWRHGREFRTFGCPYPRQIPLPQPQPYPQQCGGQGQTLSFSVAAGSSEMTEVSGPQLSPTEQFTYGGQTYTVMTVNPGAGQFTAFVNNSLFTNGGATITDATGAIACGGSSSSYSG